MRALIVEDQPELARQLQSILEGSGFSVDVAADGIAGHDLGSKHSYDAIVLDLGLPKMNGLTVLKKWREGGVFSPVLILAATDRWTDKVAGLDAGADDYLAKPFEQEELLARVRALVRRTTTDDDGPLTAGSVVLDVRSGRVSVSGEPIKLTAREYMLLKYLLKRKGAVVTRREILSHIYDRDFTRDSKSVEVFITRLRKKLGVDIITTLRGVGYSVGDPQ